MAAGMAPIGGQQGGAPHFKDVGALQETSKSGKMNDKEFEKELEKLVKKMVEDMLKSMQTRAQDPGAAEKGDAQKGGAQPAGGAKQAGGAQEAQAPGGDSSGNLEDLIEMLKDPRAKAALKKLLEQNPQLAGPLQQLNQQLGTEMGKDASSLGGDVGGGKSVSGPK